MRNIITVNGIPIIPQEKDLDKDGKIGGIERVPKDKGVIPIKEQSEVADLVETAFPKEHSQIINMLGNIHETEERLIFLLIVLCNLRFLPKSVLKTADVYLLLSVSRNARGRDDIRDYAQAHQQKKESSKLANFVGVGDGK